MQTDQLEASRNSTELYPHERQIFEIEEDDEEIFYANGPQL
jgi:hypothetical protein